MRPGCYDPIARVADMDRAGIAASLCFPSFPRFCGQTFYEATDRELGLLCVRAYNDWMLDEWCGSAPGRLIPQIIIPLWDPQAAATEIDRCASLGARALTFSENPARLGLPSIHSRDRYWDPVFAAAAANEVVLCTHIGSSSHVPSVSDDSPSLVTFAWSFAAMSSGTTVDWWFSSVFQRFANLKIALSRGRDRLDSVFPGKSRTSRRQAALLGGAGRRHCGHHDRDRLPPRQRAGLRRLRCSAGLSRPHLRLLHRGRRRHEQPG